MHAADGKTSYSRTNICIPAPFQWRPGPWSLRGWCDRPHQCTDATGQPKPRFGCKPARSIPNKQKLRSILGFIRRRRCCFGLQTKRGVTRLGPRRWGMTRMTTDCGKQDTGYVATGSVAVLICRTAVWPE